MKILIAGANGYIGTRLLTLLAEEGHQIVAFVRSARRLVIHDHLSANVEILEGDLLHPETYESFPKDIDIGYYLVHSMGSQASGFSELEATCAQNFTEAMEATDAKQIIYLSGLARQGKKSEHIKSRHHVEKNLNQGKIPVTILRAGIIVGAGSASFEVIRDLVEKLPIMVAPRWVYSRCQPIGVVDVLHYLKTAIGNTRCLGEIFEVGGPDILTYRSMLQQFAKVRNLKRLIIPVPFLTPYLSSLWLFFVTSVNFSIARAIVKSLKTDAVCRENRINEVIPHDCLDFQTTIKMAFEKIEQNAVISSWKDAIIQSELNPKLSEYIDVPTYGCYKEVEKKSFNTPKHEVIDHLWKIGGENGWYTMDWAWVIRGWIDRIFGGVGIRRGRTHPAELHNGDALDFWRVLNADREHGHLLLYAEMKLPGEAWLEWKITGDGQSTTVEQIATFRPRGLLARIYWYSLVPMHSIIFSRLCNSIGKAGKEGKEKL